MAEDANARPIYNSNADNSADDMSIRMCHVTFTSRESIPLRANSCSPKAASDTYYITYGYLFKKSNNKVKKPDRKIGSILGSIRTKIYQVMKLRISSS
ncbi:hypothetical protein AVEN_12016-1 [Araneus ventricosus]|uniref:Uncharacterized protein n=1 Tax=Araneus ventricosus TaxID=182803 RepID=A0A4Y2G6M1_ARAVE|nr:hypothetical protein AVEN_12016-1 [Araneus ventricosus]